MRAVKSKKEKGKNCLGHLLLLICLFTFNFLLTPSSPSAQSSDQNFPTHVTTNEINGVIKPRIIGDARLTTYFYLFEGSQGDIFINVATTNFSGDIDVYAVDSLKPLTKMVMYADAGSSETGRLIYLRQPARLLLRIEGRTPNDDAATFRIKFAGSFVALASEKSEPPPTVAKQSVESRESSESGKTKETTSGNASVNERASTDESKSENQNQKTEDQKPKSEETIYENKSAKVTVKPAKPSSNPLANVNLVVVFRDGTVLTRPMTEISRFSFDNGRLTIIEKNGKITRYQMTDIVKVTIE